MVPPFYDSLMAKIIAHGPDRATALRRMHDAIASTAVSGVATNLPFHARCSASRTFSQRRRDTEFVAHLLERACAWRASPWLTSAGRDLAARRQPVPLGRARYRHREDAHDRAGDGPGGLQGDRFHDLDAHGRSRALQARGPWERIRLMAAATPKTPLQFMSTGFRFISWETASPEFMALAYPGPGSKRHPPLLPRRSDERRRGEHRLRAHGEAGGRRVRDRRAGLTLSPIHDDAHYADARATLASSPDVDALYIKDPGGLLAPARASTLIPAVKARIGGKPLELHSHYTIGLAELTYMDAPGHGVSALQCASGAAADGISNPPSSASSPTCARSVTRYDRQRGAGGSRRYFTSSRRRRDCRCRPTASLRRGLPASSAARRHGRDHASPSGRASRRHISKAR